jgi:hypothetical protein
VSPGNEISRRNRQNEGAFLVDDVDPVIELRRHRHLDLQRRKKSWAVQDRDPAKLTKPPATIGPPRAATPQFHALQTAALVDVETGSAAESPHLRQFSPVQIAEIMTPVLTLWSSVQRVVATAVHPYEVGLPSMTPLRRR